MTNRILVGAVFLVGCAVGGASSQIVVPKANAQEDAQEATQPQRWEQACSHVGHPRDAATQATKVVNELGAKGWELIGIAGDSHTLTACFKRPKL